MLELFFRNNQDKGIDDLYCDSLEYDEAKKVYILHNYCKGQHFTLTISSAKYTLIHVYGFTEGEEGF